MKALQGIGTVITKQTAPGYLERLAARIYDGLDVSGAVVFDREAEKIVNAGWLTWEQVETIEIKVLGGIA